MTIAGAAQALAKAQDEMGAEMADVRDTIVKIKEFDLIAYNKLTKKVEEVQGKITLAVIQAAVSVREALEAASRTTHAEMEGLREILRQLSEDQIKSLDAAIGEPEKKETTS